uniref:GTP-binding protein REM 2 n=1 Tax=Pelodiscus sinensis TaxID=13735 RepID=K7FHB3_PELSI
MTLNTQPGGKSPVRRRASTPVPLCHQARPGSRGPKPTPIESTPPPLGSTPALSAPPWGAAPSGRGGDHAAGDGPLGNGEAGRGACVGHGDPRTWGGGGTWLSWACSGGHQKRRDIWLVSEVVYERTLSVDGEETTLLVMDPWETEKREEESQPGCSCLQVGNAYVLVYSVTDRGSFESASELRIQLRRVRQAENIPIILVGNKKDLVRCREVSVEEGRACAVVFDCKFIETSAALQHNVAELFEGVVRQLRLRR